MSNQLSEYFIDILSDFIQENPINLFLKISVLQANLFWLGDFEKIICPWKESVSLERTIQGVRGYLMSQNAVMWYLSETTGLLFNYNLLFILLSRRY